ncbi:MAG: CopD family protein [Gemmatimonadota bacterium]
MGSILDGVTGWTLYAGLMAMLGASAGQLLIVPRAAREVPEAAVSLSRAASRLALAGALLLLPAMTLYFVRQLLEFRDPFVPWSEDAELLLTGTDWGRTWLWGAVASALAAVVFGMVARGVRSAWWVGGALTLVLAAFPALTGHASGSDGPRALLLGADVLHVWAAGGWMGALTLVLYAERRWRSTDHGPEAPGSLLPALLPVFSPLAVACVGVLVLTGVLGAWVHVPGPSALFTSRYGLTLLAKLVFVAVALGLGFVNWRRLTPGLAGDGGPSALRRAATFELLVVQAVLIVTALLVRTAPPMG